MSAGPQTSFTKRHLWNWTSFAGGVIAFAGFFAFLLLSAIDFIAHASSPYVGILAYVVAPSFLIFGLALMALGAWMQHRHSRQSGGTAWEIDFSRLKDRRKLALFAVVSTIFLICTAMGSYQTYHMSESVEFCGETCHTPMHPEFTAYQNSPHARVACVECHVGSGAKAYVAAKWNGVHQMVCVFTGKYHRPIETPIKNLRPAQETCEQCHWPGKFDGNLDRTYNHFLTDKTNTQFSVRLLLHVGGADPALGPVGGIHWHVSQNNKIEYIATDDKRQVIPWVRVTNSRGEVTEYRDPSFKGDISKYEIRRMDCIDCHNRPAHNYRAPNDSVDLAMSLGQIDRTMPWVKSNAVEVLTRPYQTTDEAVQKIATTLRSEYPTNTSADGLVASVQTIYTNNFFPEMKVDWQSYPVNIGHKNWPGCFRCHDGSHKTADKKKTIPASDCNTCHTIIAQGNGDDLQKLNGKGNVFFHIDSEYTDFSCNTCHTGGIQK